MIVFLVSAQELPTITMYWENVYDRFFGKCTGTSYIYHVLGECFMIVF